MKPHETLNVIELIQCCNAGENPKFIFFWGHLSARKDGINKSCLSQWYLSSFSFNNISYPTAEHFMMAEKARLFNDLVSEKKILTSNNPGAAKAIGRGITGFNNSIWEQHRFAIVTLASYLKFSQNSDLKDFLIGTQNRVLVEASPQDTIWGIGLAEQDERVYHPVKWRGLNLLGFALMAAREHLINGSTPF